MFNSADENYLGIDLGTTSIKLVELAKAGSKVRLRTYGFTEPKVIKPIDWQNDPASAAEIIKRLADESGVSSRRAVSALPAFSVFSSIISLSSVPDKDLAQAVYWEAKKVIPLPLNEMRLNWTLMEDDGDAAKNPAKKKEKRVLLIGAPKSLVEKYEEIFRLAGFELSSLEPETLSLVRSLVGNDHLVNILVDIGSLTSDVVVVDNVVPMFSRSIDVGGMTITRSIATQLGVAAERAELFKFDLAADAFDSLKGGASKAIAEALEPVLNEIKYAVGLYQSKNQKNIDKIVLSGGSSLLPGLSEYFSRVLNLRVVVASPWSRISYPVDLEPLLNGIAPRMAVAAGLAMKNIK
jgi:type IV pilus assembly protein PilM